MICFVLFVDFVLLEWLSPRGADWLAHEEGRIRARPWPVLLHSAVVDLGDVEITVRVDAHPVHAPHAAGVWTPHPPRVHEVPIQVVLDDLVRPAVGRPQRAVAHD